MIERVYRIHRVTNTPNLFTSPTHGRIRFTSLIPNTKRTRRIEAAVTRVESDGPKAIAVTERYRRRD